MSKKYSATTSMVLREVANHIDILGEEHTLNIILKDRIDNYNITHVDKIIAIICSHFSISLETIHKRGRNDVKRMTVLGFICYYCCTKIPVSQELIALKLKRSQCYVSRRCAAMQKKRKDKNKSNETIQRWFKELDEKVSTHLKTIGKSNKSVK